MRLTEEEYATFQQQHAIRTAVGTAIAKARTPPLPYANRLEADYAALLELRKRAGELHDWRYQPLRLILANRCTYEPDFLVIATDQTLELHETKGGWFRDDARVKVKVVARLFPWFKLVIVTRKSIKAGWQYEEIMG